MEIILNQPLFARLQLLSSEPAETCLHVHTYGAEGRIYISYKKLMHVTFRDLEGEAALLSMFFLKDSWMSESAACCPVRNNMDCFIEDFLMETLSQDPLRKNTRAIEIRKSEKKFERPIAWQGLIRDYEITLTTVGGPWDGHTFNVYPGDNLIGKMPECEVHLPADTVSRRHCSILLSESQIRVIDLGSLNGTYLNGTLISDAAIAPEDELCIGNIILRVHYSLRRPEMGVSEEKEGEVRKTDGSPRVAECKTINWKEFVPKKQQIFSKIIHGLGMR